MIEISANTKGRGSVLNPTLIRDKDSLILIDAGFPCQLDEFKKAFEKEGTPFGELNTVILTNQHIDHIGSASDILKEISGRVEVLAHEKEKPYISGEKKTVKFEEGLEHLPDNAKAIYTLYCIIIYEKLIK